jgi:glycosyltransferase involved in cell wall biosynthesis
MLARNDQRIPSELQLESDIAASLSASIAPGPPCTFLLYAGGANAGSPERFGQAQYSYHIVMQAFRTLLRRFGIVRIILDPENEVDDAYLECRERGESCFFFSFGPPHLMTLGLRCPTVPVIAWEFGTIPDQSWDDDPRNDWRYGLRAAGKVIMLSHFASHAVRRAMGAQFPIIAIPAPIYDRFAGATSAKTMKDVESLTIDGFVWDSRVTALSAGMAIPSPPPLPEKRQLVSLRHAGQEEAEALQRVVDEVVRSAAGEQSPEPEIAPSDGAPKTLGRRISITLRLALNWYCEAVRDLIPPPFGWLMRRVGSWAQLTWHWTRGVGRWDGRPSFYRRLQATKYYALQWYREVVEDALPTVLSTKLTRAVNRLDLAKRRHPAVVEVAAQEPSVEPLTLSPALTIDEPEPPVQEPSVEPLTLSPALAIDEPEPLPVNPHDMALPTPEMAVSSAYPDDPVEPEEPARLAGVRIDGVVFTAVFAPKDGRKNWQDLLTAFCTTFRARADATLVFKMIGRDTVYWWHEFHDIINRLPKFECRVVVLHGHLDNAQYRTLIEASHYVVNTSLAEGLCLPLVEFMSAGRPAIAPRHTAMSDYIDSDNAIVVNSGEEYCGWPHDPRNMLESSRHRIEWPSICEALEEAYRLVAEDRVSYDRMSLKAAQRMRSFCSDTVIAQALASFLGLGDEALLAAGFGGSNGDAARCSF